MNVWLLAGAGMLALLAPCMLVALRGSPVERLLGLELGGAIVALALVLVAEGFNRSIYFDLALAYAVTSFVTDLVFLRFLERWL